jgi:uncharacterized membrane protein YdjX (TVP38/TMEM64 family)
MRSRPASRPSPPGSHVALAGGRRLFLVYVVVTALSLPGAAVMTLAGGAFFGLWTGLLLVSFASSIGATLAFLVSRFLLRDWVQRPLRRAAGGDQRRHGARRRVLPVRAASGAGVSVLHHQPG